MSKVVIEGIWLRYVGGENDPHARVVVEVERDGRWVEIINELYVAAFSHCVTAEGISVALARDTDHQFEVSARRSQGHPGPCRDGVEEGIS